MEPNKRRKTPISLKLLALIVKVGTPIFPNTIKKLILTTWNTPPKFRLPEREKNAIKAATAAYIPIDNMKIRTWSWGSGPTVLFIHGWAGRGSQACSFIKELNDAGFRVMGFDLPAHGQSTGINQTDYIVMANAIKRVIENIDDLHSVITHSFGGLLFANVYHHLTTLKSVVFICPPSGFQTMFNYFNNEFSLPIKINDQIINTVIDDIGEETINQFSTLKNVSAITQPVMVVHDKNDDTVPFENGEQIASRIKHCIFVESKGLGHRKILYDENTIKSIVEFIKKA